MVETELIAKEMARAEQARRENNEGMVRVCVRRAVGAAVRGWSARRATPGAWGQGASAVQILRAMKDDRTFPEAVRSAAMRLSTTVDRDHHLPFAEDPLDDARLIIDFLARP